MRLRIMAAAALLAAPQLWTLAARAQEGQAFTSAAQAQAYLNQNPAGPRAEIAFRAIADADIAARNPEFNAGQIALGSALVLAPGAVATPAEVMSVIDQLAPALAASGGGGLF